jgi:hypothetical protein
MATLTFTWEMKRGSSKKADFTIQPIALSRNSRNEFGSYRQDDNRHRLLLSILPVRASGESCLGRPLPLPLLPHQVTAEASTSFIL